MISHRGLRTIASLTFASTLSLGIARTTSAQTTSAGGTGGSVVTTPPVSWGSPRVDPRITSLFAHRTRFGETLPAFRRSRRFEREGTLPVVVRFARTSTPSERATLAAAGVVFARGGRPLFSGAYSVRTDAAGIAALARDTNVARVEIDLPLAAPRPLDQSAIETRIADARRVLRARDGRELDGTGVVIGDVDTGAFYFHPAFFRADGGNYAWVDVNHNGHFDPGVDGVDLDHDGTITPSEVTQLLPASFVDVYGRPMNVSTGAPRFDRDWLYCDTDGNQTRDYGAPYDDSTPAFGEPIFVLDDANHDNVAQPSEHFLRLGTSKFRAVLGTTTYTRGNLGMDGLINAWDPTADVSHGTGVAGILVGGVPNVSRLLGLAPNAEILLTDDTQTGDSGGTMGGLQWEMDQGANVLLTEYAPYAYVTLDGSSEEELLLDAALDHDVVPVSPAGNLAQGHKHQHLELMAGDNDLPAHTDAYFTGARLIQFSLHHRAAGRTVAVTVVMPNGMTLALPLDEPNGHAFGNYVAYTSHAVTARGTIEQHVLLYRSSGLPEGDYTLRFTPDAGDPIDSDLYVGDDRTSWANGFSLEGNDVPRTICHPATSDHTLAVAAYVLHGEEAYGPWGPPQALANYSSRGPRIDDMRTIDLAAPDNPMSTTSLHDDVPYAAYTPFGGTSGAGPHVAASVALLRQLDPTASAASLRERIVSTARTDDTVMAGGTDSWGAGRLDLAAAAMLVPEHPAGTAPRVTLEAPSDVTIGAMLRVVATVVDDGSASDLRYRWDLDNDGTFETAWGTETTQTIPTQSAGLVDVRVEVRDADGNLSGATARVQIAAAAADAGFVPPAISVRGGCTCTSAPPASRTSNGGTGALAMVGLMLVAARRRTRTSASKARAALAGIPRDC